MRAIAVDRGGLAEVRVMRDLLGGSFIAMALSHAGFLMGGGDWCAAAARGSVGFGWNDDLYTLDTNNLMRQIIIHTPFVIYNTFARSHTC